MPRVVSHSEVEAIAPGGTLSVDPEALITPLALEQAREKGVTIVRGAPGAAVISGGASPAVIRQVTQAVVDRLGDAGPDVLEAVITEVVQALGAGIVGGPNAGEVEVAPGIDFCQMCVEQERARTRHRAVLTTTGRNSKGIVARVTGKIAELGGDILDISQTLVGDYFTMIIVVDTASLDVPFADFKQHLEEEVQALGLQTMMMHEDVVTSLHRI
jgi:ACT domain-containing protein